MIDFPNEPNEVVWVKMLSHYKIPISLTTLDKCEEIMKRHPEYFPKEEPLDTKQLITKTIHKNP